MFDLKVINSVLDQLEEERGIAKEKVLEAIEMARLQGEPLAMLTGFRDISKMMGYNAPEVKKVEVTSSQGRLRHKIQSLSDEDLMRMAEGEDIDDVIDGEARIVG